MTLMTLTTWSSFTRADETDSDPSDANPVVAQAKLSEVLEKDLTGLETSVDSDRARAQDDAATFAQFLKNPTAQTSVDFVRRCQEDRESNSLCDALEPVAVERETAPPRVRALYVATLKQLDASDSELAAKATKGGAGKAAARPGKPASPPIAKTQQTKFDQRCAAVSSDLQKLAATPEAEPLVPSVLYWLHRCVQRHAPAQAEALRTQLWNRFPIDYHTLRAFSEAGDARLRDAVANDVDLPAFFRSANNDAFNRAVAALEVFYRDRDTFSASIAGQRLGGKWGKDGAWRNVEHEACLYFATLMARVGRDIPSVLPAMRAFAPLVRERFRYKTKRVYELMFPLEYPGSAESAAQLIREESAPGADRHLLLAIAHRESALNPRAASDKTAFGLMQLRIARATDAQTRDERREQPLTPELLQEPRLNVRLGARAVSAALAQNHGDAVIALGGYHAGEANVADWERATGHIRDEMLRMDLILMSAQNGTTTSAYVARVLARREYYRLLYPNFTEENRPPQP